MRASTTADARRGGEQKTATALACAPLLALALGAQPPPPAEAPLAAFAARVERVLDVDRVRLADGRIVRLQGLSLPHPSVRAAGAADRLRAALQQQLDGREVWVQPEVANAAGDTVDLTATVARERGGTSVNEALLADGLAVLSCRTPQVERFDALRAAATRAQREQRGWFARPTPPRDRIPYLNGAVLGLHYQLRRERYVRHLDELQAAGFRHLSLLFPAFLRDAESTDIDVDHPRTVRDERLIETIHLAQQRQMTVMLVPILLLEEPAEGDWRGTLRPHDLDRFWLEYDRFLAHYLDIAEATGVDLVSIGSELSSLEQYTEAWRRVIANARGRFRGWLTYSANWDHVHVPRFFGQLDLVGLTGYYSLTELADPSPAQLVDGWRRVAEDLGRSVGMLGKPVVFTELGYPSQDGANRDPWNYVMNPERVDLAEQAQCFAAFLEVAPEMDWLAGAYFYDFFDEGGALDPSYSPRGKPAMQEWRRWAALRR